MNFKKIATLVDQKDNQGYGIKTDMFGVLKTMEAPDQYGNVKCSVVDDTGIERGVQFKGKDLPQANMLGHRVLSSVWAESFTSNKSGKKCVSYKAWLKNANVAQKPAPQQNGTSQTPKPQQTDDVAGKCRCQIVCAGISSRQLKCETPEHVLDWTSFIMTGKIANIPVGEPQQQEELPLDQDGNIPDYQDEAQRQRKELLEDDLPF